MRQVSLSSPQLLQALLLSITTGVSVALVWHRYRGSCPGRRVDSTSSKKKFVQDDADTAAHIGIMPSKADALVWSGKLKKVEQSEVILDIAGGFMRGLDYQPPPFPQDPALYEAVVNTLESWNIGDAVDGFMKCVDVGVAAAEARLLFCTHLSCTHLDSNTALLSCPRVRLEDYNCNLHSGHEVDGQRC